MSKEIDQRVVEMQFDNAKFEKNVSVTMKTIDGLKQNLDFEKQARSFDSLTKAANNVDISMLGKAADAVGKKFTALEVAVYTAISNITNRVIGGAENIINQVSDLAMAGQGWDKYNKKVQAVQTIMKATGEDIDSVSYKLQDLADYTDKTSYSYSQMVDNIGKFTANGVNLDDAIKAIEGVANVAALSGVGAADPAAARAMYNFSQALASGAVKAIDWKSIENANMATKQFKDQIIKTAKAIGTLNAEGKTAKGTVVTFQNFRDTLQEGWFSSDVLIATLKEFADAESEIGKQAYLAAAEAKTFQDALGAIQDGLSSSWSKTFEYIFGNYEQATKLWTEIQDTVLEFMLPKNERRNSMLYEAMTSQFTQISDKMSDLGVSTETWENAVIQAMKNIGVGTDFILKNQSLKELFDNLAAGGFDAAHIIKDAFRLVSGETVDLTAKTEEYKNLIDDIINGKWGHGADRFAKLLEAGYNDDFVQNLVNKTVYGETIEWEKEFADNLKLIGTQAKLTEEQLAELDSMADDVSKEAGRLLLIDSVRQAFNALRDILGAVREAWTEVFPPLTGKQLYDIIARIREFTLTLKPSEKTLDNVKRTVRGFASALKAVGSILGGLIEGVTGVFKGINTAGFSFSDLTAKVGDALGEFAKWVDESKVVESVATGVSNAIKNVWTWLTKLYDTIKNSQFVQSTIKSIESIFADGGFFTILGDNIKQFFNDVGSVFEFEGGFFAGLWTSVTTFFSNTASRLSTWWETIRGPFDLLFDTIKSFFTSITDFISTEGALANLVATIILVATLFTSIIAVHKIGSALSDVADAFYSIGKGIKNLSKSVLFASASTLLTSLGTLIGIIAGTVVVFSSLPAADIDRSIKNVLKIGGLIVGMVVVLGLLSKVGSKDVRQTAASTASLALMIFGVATLVGSIGFVLNLLSSLVQGGNAESVWEAFDEMLLRLVGIFATLAILSKVTRGGKISGGGAILATSLSLLILVSVVKKLGNTKPDKLARGLRGLGSLVVAFLPVFVGLALLGQKVKGVGTTIILTVVALRLLVSTIKKLSDQDPSAMIKGLENLQIALLPLAEIFLMLSLTRGAAKDAAKGVFIIILAIGALSLIVRSLAGVSEDIWNVGVRRFGVLALITGIMLVLANVFSSIEKTEKTAKRSGFFKKETTTKSASSPILRTLIGMTIMLVTMGVLVSLLGSMQMHTLSRGVIVVGILSVLVTMMTLSAAALGQAKISEEANKTLIILAVTLTLMGGILYLLASMPNPYMVRPVAEALGILLLSLSASLLIISKAKGFWQLGRTLSVLGVLVLVVAAFGAILWAMGGGQGWNGTQNAIANATALSEMLIALGATLALIALAPHFQKGEVSKVAEVLAALTAVVAAFGAILWAMGGGQGWNGTQNAIANATALSEMLIALGVSFFIISYGKEFQNAWGVMGTLAVMGACVVAFGFAISLLKDMDPLSALVSATALSELLLSLGVSFLIITHGKGMGWAQMGTTIITLIAMTGVLFLISLILKGLDELKTDGLLAKSTALSEVLLALAASMVIVGLAGMVSPSALFAGIAGFLLLALGVFLVLEVIHQIIGTAENAKNFSETTVPILESIGEGIGRFLGGLVGGFIGSASEAIVDSLLNIVRSIVTFTEELGDIDTSHLEALSAVANAILALTAAKVLEGIYALFGGESGYGKLMEELPSLGESLNTFASKLSDLKNSDITKAKKAAEMVSVLAGAVPKSGGLLGIILGDQNFKNFGDGMSSLATGIQTFVSTLRETSIDDAMVAKADIAAGIVKSVADVVPKSGGLMGLLLGNQDFAGFAAGIALIGGGVAGFVKNLSTTTIDDDAKNKAIRAADMLKAFGDAVPRTGGVLGMLLGEQKFDDFAYSLPLLGSGIAGFFFNLGDVSDIDTDTVGKVADVLTKLGEVAPDKNGILQDIFGGGKENLADFAANFPELGKGVRGFVDEIKSIKDWTALTRAVDNVGKLVDFAATLGQIDPSEFYSFNAKLQESAVTGFQAFIDAFGDEAKLEEVKTQADNIAYTFTQALFANGSSFESSALVIAQTVLDTIKSDEKLAEFKGAGDAVAGALKNGLLDNKASAVLTMETLIDGMYKAVRSDSYQNEFINLGQWIIWRVREGITKSGADSAASQLLTAAKEKMGDDIYDALLTYKASFETIGINFLDGLRIGLQNQAKLNAIYNASYSAGSTAARGTQKALDEHSPSRVAELLGINFDQGLINGILSKLGLTEKAGSLLGENALSGLTEALGGETGLGAILGSDLSDLLGEDGLTLTPVLDLSKITEGASGISSILDQVNGVSVGGSFDIASITQNSGFTGSLGLEGMFNELSQQMADFMNTPNTSITNTFNITGDDPQSIAEEVSKIITQQSQREAHVWA